MSRLAIPAAVSLAALCAALCAACAPDGAMQADAAAPAVAEEPMMGSEERLIARGQFIAENNCAECHATGTTGDSPRPDAPPLRRVLLQYQAESLRLDFVHGLRVGHPDMPRFQFEPAVIDALIAYLMSVQDWGVVDASPEQETESAPS